MTTDRAEKVSFLKALGLDYDSLTGCWGYEDGTSVGTTEEAYAKALESGVC
jgi:hypothetical protein